MRFGPAIAQDLRSRRPRPHGQWHLDEMFVSIGGKWMYLWRAVDAEGEVLDCLVQSRRDTRAAKKLMRQLLKKQVIREVPRNGFVTLSHCCRTLAAVDERNETSVVRRLSFPA